ncbi:hypothetical protein PQX77_001906 [Marasmius sp. AFHP31]|nr:hypothetical protein PQX77_020586 [Marasmius sp. AFHP31]KAK1219597.1 hypothetical protein PQX77_017693 [Marasmius sp. AFHP31]KAK1230880.1 hypothetical protein PQX77_006019 [Marasmius sp. AFHP31]KAK1234883.1 hypothetical protein PQX77_001906 [Marasmius sp. AFHP31]
MSSINPLQPHKCSSQKCKTILPGDYGFKTCQKCRDAKKQSAAKKKSTTNQEQHSGQRKRARDEDEHPGSREAPCPPHNLARGTSASLELTEEIGESTDEEGTVKRDVQIYKTPKELFDAMRAVFKRTGGKFQGRFTLPHDVIGVDHHERVKMTCLEVWRAIGYRFTVKENKKLPTGWRTRYFCSQDRARKKKSKKVSDAEKHRDNLGMKRFDCKSKLVITSHTVNDEVEVYVRLDHHDSHLQYTDVSLPESALEYIRDHLQFKPNDLVKTLKPDYQNITSAQVYSAWLRLSEVLWRRADDQMESARLLLRELENAGEIDVFASTSLDGIVQLSWGMKKVAWAMKDYTVVELGIDATCKLNSISKFQKLTPLIDNTNSTGLELYGVLGEYDGAGYPLAYCLLSTASSTTIGKRIIALELFASQLRDTYSLWPRHYHVDKDMAEIRIAQTVWPGVNISLCLWHLNRAVDERLKKLKLSTTPYNVTRAHAEYSFIEMTFRPPGKPDLLEYEGGCLDLDVSQSLDLPSATPNPNALFIRIPATQSMTTPPSFSTSVNTHTVHEPSDLDPDENEGKRVFCPRNLRQPILDMMGEHYCAHPMIPGFSAPTPEGIRYWAVKQVYDYCYANDLKELWAYLWENWYRAARWKLWARSSYPSEVPRLKTTMILESHWKQLKHAYLDHFSNPRIDFLIWIVVVRAGNAYLNSFQHISIDNGRWTHRSSWRKDFKREWKRCKKAPISIPLNPRYRPDPCRWVCTCPYFASSRFLVCKHLVQMVHDVNPVFFWEVQRNRAAPWYTHSSLRPLDPSLTISPTPTSPDPDNRATDEYEDADTADRIEDDDSSDDDGGFGPSEPTIALSQRAKLLRDFADGLEFQEQFFDPRLAKALEKNGKLLFKMAEECLRKEKLLNSTRSARPLTWDSALSQAMFWRARPAERDS